MSTTDQTPTTPATRTWVVRTPGDECDDPAQINAAAADVEAAGTLTFRDENGDLISAYSDWTEAHQVHVWENDVRPGIGAQL